MVDSSGLENRYSSEQRTIEGSNPSHSFFSVKIFLSLLILPGLVSYIIKGNGSVMLSHLAELEKKKIHSI